MNSYEIQIFDYADQWYFFDTIQAKDEDEARKIARKNYGKGYRIMSVHPL